MYTENTTPAILRGLTALDKAVVTFVRICRALNKIRQNLTATLEQSFEVDLPGMVSHPTKTDYVMHYKIKFDASPNLGVRVLVCTCGNGVAGHVHHWMYDNESEIFDAVWIHMFKSMPLVMEKLTEHCGPKFRKRVEELEEAAEVIGPYLNLR